VQYRTSAPLAALLFLCPRSFFVSGSSDNYSGANSDGKNSKAERRLQIDAPIRGGLGKGLACESIGKTEK
jgi:hypothetical protein